MDQIDQAVSILRRGGLVAFPTETVYGLGADARNADAVRRVFAAKGRPGTNPLIVHVANATVAERYAAHWPQIASRLAERFWPGPLTLVLPKSSEIVPEATAGRDTVGLRSPDHPLTLELLRRFDGPLVGPSANRSTRVSPTTAGHVHKELGAAVEVILDGGPCRVGIESTVLDLTHARPTILRPGAVSRQQIEQLIGPVDLFAGVTPSSVSAASPGQQAVHYSPVAPAYRFSPDQRDRMERWCRAHAAEPAMILALQPHRADEPGTLRLAPAHQFIAMPHDAASYGRQLYALLHDADARGVKAIWIELPPDQPQWHAIRDRLRRATRPAEAAEG